MVRYNAIHTRLYCRFCSNIVADDCRSSATILLQNLQYNLLSSPTSRNRNLLLTTRSTLTFITLVFTLCPKGPPFRDNSTKGSELKISPLLIFLASTTKSMRSASYPSYLSRKFSLTFVVSVITDFVWNRVLYSQFRELYTRV